MSMMQSIAHFKKPLAQGADREVFYSRRYGLVFKRDRRDKCGFSDRGEQMANERKIFLSMTDEEKEIFPIVDILEVNDELVIAMRKCKVIGENKKIKHLRFSCELKYIDRDYEMRIASQALGLNEDYVEPILEFMEKYHLKDIHPWNLGIMNNHLVIIDAGY